MTLPTITVIVPNYQGREIFRKCVDSLLRQEFDSYEILFVDDGSTDGSAAAAKQAYRSEPKVRVIAKPKNTGYVGACNTGLKHAKGQYVIVTNNDATFPKDWLREMHATVKGKQNVIGASLVINESFLTQVTDALKRHKYIIGTVTTTGGVLRRLTPEEKASGLIEVQASGVLIIPRKALKDRIFEPEYFAYGEDTELCWRLRLRGYHVVLNPRAKMHHAHSFTRKKVPGYQRRSFIHEIKNNVVNFLVFYERKNLVRLLPPYLALQTLLFLGNPPEMIPRLKAYWWVVSNPGLILRWRKEKQRARIVSDDELFGMVSYRLHDPALATSPARAKAARFLNACMRTYCRLLRIRTYDIKNDSAYPRIDKQAVQRL